ncbi:MAG: UDP-N-acetylglucosamine 1-carboxyvinyltransferase [Acidobacteriota bacterium]
MASLLIRGGRGLTGVVDVEGNKNAALPLLAACLLTDQPCTLRNVPRIGDVQVMVDLLRDLGAEVQSLDGTTLRVTCADVKTDTPDPRLVGRLRGSVLLLGPLLARRGRAALAQPGGDFPARRTMAVHLSALAALGARPVAGDVPVLELDSRLRPASIYLDEASVTGTETALLAAAAAEGLTEIRHAACEPHVVELARFLRQMGAAVSGEGSPTIRIEGVARRRGVSHHLEGDYIEAGTWAVVSAVTRGDVEVRGARREHLEVVTNVLRRFEVDFALDEDRLRVRPSRLAGGGRVTTGVWPGFPSDLVSLVTVLATQADGDTLLHDWMYELRLFALDQLSGMGAQLFLCDPHRIIVTGHRRLRARVLDGRDLRSGMALVAAALAADGESRVGPLETIQRGYGKVQERLASLGADVTRVE